MALAICEVKCEGVTRLMLCTPVFERSIKSCAKESIKDGVLAIPMKYDYEVIRKQFSGMKKMTLHYTLHEDSKRVNGKHNGKDEKYVIQITSPYTEVDVVNEPQKTLKITLK